MQNTFLLVAYNDGTIEVKNVKVRGDVAIAGGLASASRSRWQGCFLTYSLVQGSFLLSFRSLNRCCLNPAALRDAGALW